MGIAALAVPITASTWQGLFNVYLLLGVIGAGVSVGALVFFSVKYKDRGQKTPVAYKSGEKIALALVALMAVALVIAANATYTVAQFQANPPDASNAVHIQVIGRQWSWEFRYPNGIDSVGLLTVPYNTTVILNVTSVDVLHNFGIPDFKVKTDATPGYYASIWFVAPDAGNHTILCYELCGVGHALMIAKMEVVSPSSYQQWYASGGK